MLTTEQPKLDTVEAIAQDTLSGNTYFRAWCAVVNAVREVAPEVLEDRSRPAVENVVTWIKQQGS
jgi:hypothetical protein